MDLETNDQAPAVKEGKSRLGRILEEKSKLNLSTSRRSRRIHNGANRSGTGGSISIQRQTLRANNRALAKSLQQYKQELNHANNVILELTNQRQALQIRCNAASRVAELKNVEIEKEVQQRMEKKFGELKELISMIEHLAGQGIDKFWGMGSSRLSVGISASRSSLEADRLDEVSPEVLRAALQRSIYGNQSTQDVNSHKMLRGSTLSKQGDLSLVIEKSMLDDIGPLPFEDVSTSLTTVSETDELKRRSSSIRQSKGRRSNLLDVDSIRNTRVSGLRASEETSEKSTPRTSDIDSQQKSGSFEKSSEAIPGGSTEQTKDKMNTSKSPSDTLTRNPILDPDERPLDVATGRPAKATFTFIAFENEKPKSPGLGNLAVKKGKSTLPLTKRDVAREGSKGKPGNKKSAPVSKRVRKEEEVDPGKMLELGREKKPDEAAPREIEASDSVHTEQADPKPGRRETFCVPKENAPEKETEITARMRRGPFAVTNEDKDSAGNTDIAESDTRLNNLDESGNESLGILSTTVLEEVDMELTCVLRTAQLGNEEKSQEVAANEVVPDELDIDNSTPSGCQNSHPEQLVAPETTDYPESMTTEPYKADSSKSDDSSDGGKKEKKFAVYQLKPGKIKFVAGRKNVNGDFKVPNLKPRSRLPALSKSKSRSRSKQKSKPIKLPLSNPPSAFDFIGLTPEKPPTKGVFDMSCNESADSECLTLKQYRENKGGAVRVPKAKGEQDGVSTDEGRMEFSDHKLKKRAASASVTRKSGAKVARGRGCKRKPGSDSNTDESDESVVFNRKKNAVVSSSSDTSFADDDSKDEDSALPLKPKLLTRTESRTRRETVTVVARSQDDGGDEFAAPVRKSSLKSGSGSRRLTVTVAAPTVDSGDKEPKKLNVTFEMPSDGTLESGRMDLDSESSNQRTKDERVENQTVLSSSCDGDEEDVPASVNTTFKKVPSDEVVNTTFEKPDAMNTSSEKPSVGDAQKVKENGDHRLKKTVNRKVVKSKTRTKSKKVEDSNSDASCNDDVAAVTNERRSARKSSRRATVPEVEPPVCDDDEPQTGLNGTFEILCGVEQASSEDNQSKNMNETFEKLPSVGLEPDSCEVQSYMKEGNAAEEAPTDVTTISLDVPVPMDDDSFGDISNFWDKKTPRKKEPVVVETEGTKEFETEQKESRGDRKTTGSEEKELDVGKGSRHGTSELRQIVEKKQKNERKSAKSARRKVVDCDSGAERPTEIEKVAKNIKKEPRSRRRTKRVSSKPDVTLGELLNELTTGDHEEVEAGGMTMMLEELCGKLDAEMTPDSPVVKPKKRRTTRVALEDVEINPTVPAVTIKKERRSSTKSTISGQDQENLNGGEQPAKRACRNRGTVSYKEPSLNVKMRQGYKLDNIRYDEKVPDDDECTKKKKNVQKKKKSEVK